MNKEKMSKTDTDVTDSGFIFGTDVEGTVVPIQSIKNEADSVVVIGTVVNPTGREIRETNLLFFNIVDETQGIHAKVRFEDKEEYRRVLGKLKEGTRIRAKGSIRYDAYQDDLVLFVSSVKEEPRAAREDKAETKRVELHAHTQMSEMDSVVSVSKLIQTAVLWGWDAIAITDHGVVQAFPKAMKTIADNKLDIKVIYGMEGNLTGDDYKQSPSSHIIILAKTQEGLRNLYGFVSLSHLKYFHRQPRIPKRVLEEHREGLLIGAAGCEEGELLRAVATRKNEDELLAIAEFYDYLEIQPIGNYASLIQSEDFPAIRTDEDLHNINRQIAELAKKLEKPLVAAGNVHFLNPEDAIFRTILKAGKGDENAENQPPLYLRTTDEMLEKFDYLGTEAAYEAVVTNPRRIADMVGQLKPIPDTLHLPKIPDADETVREIAYQRAHQWYGDPLPNVVQQRLDWELDSIVGHGYSSLYMIAHKLVKKSNEDGYLVCSRGAVGSSFVATMTGVSEVNPLPPHYRCPKCKYSEFIDDGSYGSGFDLPDKHCPNCGKPLIKDGHDIPAATFLGFEGEKIPDIDLNFATEYQPVAHKYMKQLFGDEHVYRAGSIATVGEKTAYSYARRYYEKKGEKKSDGFIEHILKGCTGVKRTTIQHPAGLMIVPQDMDVHDFTPLQHPANKMEIEDVATHFDYHDISDRIVKFDILGHDDPAMLKMLQDMTGFDPTEIPLDDPQTLSLFRSTEALGVTPEDLGINKGTYGIPEFRTGFTRQMLDETKPTCFSELVKISGFSHGTDVWLNNARDLIRDGVCKLHDAIATRDDIIMYLIRKGIGPQLSYEIMESVRKGQSIHPDIAEKLRNAGVPEWYIESCRKIKYLFPRAHAVAYFMMSFRIAYYKVHYPEYFYAAYFALHAKKPDVDVIEKGPEAVRKKLNELEDLERIDVNQKETMSVLQVAWEMILRGYEVSPADSY